MATALLVQLVLFQLAEEIGFTGFLQHHWQDRYHPMKLTLYVALLWAVWHIPDHFAQEGWGVEQLISAPVVFAIEFVSLSFARALFVWFCNRTGYSVLLVAIFHASFDAAINQLSDDVIPGSNTAFASLGQAAARSERCLGPYVLDGLVVIGWRLSSLRAVLSPTAPGRRVPDFYRSKPVADTAGNELGWETASVLTASPARVASWP